MAQLTVAVSAVVDRGKGNPTSDAMTDESAKQVPRRAESESSVLHRGVGAVSSAGDGAALTFCKSLLNLDAGK